MNNRRIRVQRRDLATALQIPKPSQDCGFTLVELLVVMGIIAVLAALLMPAVTRIFKGSETTRAKGDLSRIVTAWENYYREYGRWPVGPGQRLFAPYGYEQDAAEGSTGMAMVVSVMTNIMYPQFQFSGDGAARIYNRHPVCTNFNAKHIQFMAYDADSLDASNNMVDPWGNIYRFMFDLNKDGRVQRGGTMATTVYASVIAWSLGPDGVLSQDDIMSWE